MEVVTQGPGLSTVGAWKELASSSRCQTLVLLQFARRVVGSPGQLLPAHLGASSLLLSPSGLLVALTVAGFLTSFSIHDPFGGQLFLSGAPTFCTHILGMQPG